jgi:hypothetical protein
MTIRSARGDTTTDNKKDCSLCMVLRIYLHMYNTRSTKSLWNVLLFKISTVYVSVSGFFSQIRDLLVSINKWEILIAVDVLIRFFRRMAIPTC